MSDDGWSIIMDADSIKFASPTPSKCEDYAPLQTKRGQAAIVVKPVKIIESPEEDAQDIKDINPVTEDGMVTIDSCRVH